MCPLYVTNQFDKLQSVLSALSKSQRTLAVEMEDSHSAEGHHDAWDDRVPVYHSQKPNRANTATTLTPSVTDFEWLPYRAQLPSC